jgi:hypothetical protein
MRPGYSASMHCVEGGRILREVSSWYEQRLGGWTLDVVPQGAVFSLLLRRKDAPEVEVNLVDTGTGLAQVLPVIVQRQFEAHGDLADLSVKEAERGGATSCPSRSCRTERSTTGPGGGSRRISRRRSPSAVRWGWRSREGELRTRWPLPISSVHLNLPASAWTRS